jgi:hypothetical protein
MSAAGLRAEDLVGLREHPKIESVLRGRELRLTADVWKVSGKTVKRRFLLLTDNTLCDLDPATLKCAHRVPVELLDGCSVDPAPGSDALIIHMNRLGRKRVKDFLLVSGQRERIMAHVCSFIEREIQRPLPDKLWDGQGEAERLLLETVAAHRHLIGHSGAPSQLAEPERTAAREAGAIADAAKGGWRKRVMGSRGHHRGAGDGGDDDDDGGGNSLLAFGQNKLGAMRDASRGAGRLIISKTKDELGREARFAADKAHQLASNTWTTALASADNGQTAANKAMHKTGALISVVKGSSEKKEYMEDGTVAIRHKKKRTKRTQPTAQLHQPLQHFERDKTGSTELTAPTGRNLAQAQQLGLDISAAREHPHSSASSAATVSADMPQRSLAAIVQQAENLSKQGSAVTLGGLRTLEWVETRASASFDGASALQEPASVSGFNRTSSASGASTYPASSGRQSVLRKETMEFRPKARVMGRVKRVEWAESSESAGGSSDDATAAVAARAADPSDHDDADAGNADSLGRWTKGQNGGDSVCDADAVASPRRSVSAPATAAISDASAHAMPDAAAVRRFAEGVAKLGAVLQRNEDARNGARKRAEHTVTLHKQVRGTLESTQPAAQQLQSPTTRSKDLKTATLSTQFRNNAQALDQLLGHSQGRRLPRGPAQAPLSVLGSVITATMDTNGVTIAGVGTQQAAAATSIQQVWRGKRIRLQNTAKQNQMQDMEQVTRRARLVLAQSQAGIFSARLSRQSAEYIHDLHARAQRVLMDAMVAPSVQHEVESRSADEVARKPAQ